MKQFCLALVLLCAGIARSGSVDAPWNKEAVSLLKILPGCEMSILLTNGSVLELEWIAPGVFGMGCEDQSIGDEAYHLVAITKGFWMSKTEITQKQWICVMGTNPSVHKGEKFPVESVSWYDCQEFIKKMNKMTTNGEFRLPTEAEWEYACRAGSTNLYSFGNNPGDISAFENVSEKGAISTGTCQVASFRPNRIGLYDMQGNVSEWCQDYYGSCEVDEGMDLFLVPTRLVVDPVGVRKGVMRAVRGGNCYSSANAAISARRGGFLMPDATRRYLGFRLVFQKVYGLTEAGAFGYMTEQGNVIPDSLQKLLQDQKSKAMTGDDGDR